MCDAEGEDTKHILQCTDPRAKTQWNLEMKRIASWMSENKTDPNLNRAITNALKHWRTSNNTNATIFRLSGNAKLAIEEQYAIG